MKTERENLRLGVELRIKELEGELRSLPFEYSDAVWERQQDIQAWLIGLYEIQGKFLQPRVEVEEQPRPRWLDTEIKSLW